MCMYMCNALKQSILVGCIRKYFLTMHTSKTYQFFDHIREMLERHNKYTKSYFILQKTHKVMIWKKKKHKNKSMGYAM